MIDNEIASLDNFKKNFSEEAYQNSEFGVYESISSGDMPLSQPSNYGIENQCQCAECISSRNPIVSQQQVEYFTSAGSSQFNNPINELTQAYQNSIVYGTSYATVTNSNDAVAATLSYSNDFQLIDGQWVRR